MPKVITRSNWVQSKCICLQIGSLMLHMNYNFWSEFFFSKNYHNLGALVATFILVASNNSIIMCIIWPFWNPKVKCASDWRNMLPMQVPCILHKFYTNATITSSTNVFLHGHTPFKQNLYGIQYNHMDPIVLKGGKLLITNNMTSSKKLSCHLLK
jgi:hypothetical protein